ALTQSAIDQGSDSLAAVLTYDYRKLDQNASLAKEKGTEQYVRQHTDLVNKGKATLTKQKQTVATKVVAVGVRQLGTESAELVIFRDRTLPGGHTNKATPPGLPAAVDLKLVDRLWRLDSLTFPAS